MTALMTWLVPASGMTRDQLADTIDRLAADHDIPRAGAAFRSVETVIRWEPRSGIDPAQRGVAHH